MIEIVNTEPSLLDKIHTIATYYSKKSQWEKAQEELRELLFELEAAPNPFGFEDCVYLTENTWSEIADVMIMLTQIIMQHGARGKVEREVAFKVKRQLERIAAEHVEIHTCETCNKNDLGLCDRLGVWVKDDDSCEKWIGKDRTKQQSLRDEGWRESMMRTFLAGH